MKKAPTYSEAYEKLEELVEQLEQGDIQLEKLAENVKQANELIAICEDKLRGIENEIGEAGEATKSKKKKKDSEKDE
jgi:exodeoxyribonuclease VII small subunit